MKFKVISVTLVISLIFGCIGTSIFAASKEELESQKSEINSQISSKSNELEEIQSELSDVAQEVQSLAIQINSYEYEIDDLNTKIEEAEEKVKEKEEEIDTVQKELEDEEELFEKRLVALYESGQTSYLDLLLSSSDLTDFVSKYYLISEIALYDSNLINDIRDTREELELAKTDLEDAKAQIEESKAQIEEKQASLALAKSSKEEKQASLSSDEAMLTEELEELQARERAVSGQIASIKAQYDASHSSTSQSTSSSSSSSSSGSSSSSSSSSYGFGWPVSNPVITTGYGVAGSYWSSGYHTGVDFQASTGTPVYSIGDGVVVDTGYSSAYGNYVQIYHGDNIYSLYAHNSSVLVSNNQNVSKGQQISYSGATGNVTGPHLHFEIRTPNPTYSCCVNPMPYLP